MKVKKKQGIFVRLANLWYTIFIKKISMPENNLKPNHFIAYLRQHFLIDKNNPIREHIVFAGKRKQIKKHLSNRPRLKTVLTKHFKDNRKAQHDVHHKRVVKWIDGINKNKIIIQKKAKRTFGQLLENQAKKELLYSGGVVPFGGSWKMKLSASIVAALILAIAIGNWQPGLSKKIEDLGNKIFIEPLLSIIDPENSLFNTNTEKIAVSKPQLIQHIVRNHHLYLADKSGREKVYHVDTNDLQGKVAGAIEVANSVGEPTAGLYLLSLQTAPKENSFKKKLEKIFFLLGEKQKEIAKDLGKKLNDLAK